MHLEAAQQLETAIEQCLWTCIELYEDELYADMAHHFAQLLAELQHIHYIDYSFRVLVDPETCLRTTFYLPHFKFVAHVATYITRREQYAATFIFK